jgi:ABC-type Fe3+/spermidine/putrescine transport system ATPase subunit
MSAGWRLEGLEADLGRFRLGPIDLEIPPGKAVAVLGRSGAGKTTLLRAIGGFLPTCEGRLLRDGEELRGSPPEERRLGYVPQGLGLFPHRTVEGNVRYPLEMRRRPDAKARTDELLERFRLAPLARRYPSRLSGGEQQRVAIARALAADPALIAWDEPWQGLDVVARHELGLVLHELRTTEQVPMIVVTHDAALAFSVADSFVVLREGRILARRDAATLLSSPSDAFTARFVGFENVYEPPELDAGASGGLRRWLAERAGPEGVAFAAPPPISDPAGAGRWEGTVRSARPAPQGLVLEVAADELLVVLRLPVPVAPPVPTVGDRVHFALDPPSLRPLGATSPA